MKPHTINYMKIVQYHDSIMHHHKAIMKLHRMTTKEINRSIKIELGINGNGNKKNNRSKK